jgi:hypothetical protein
MKKTFLPILTAALLAGASQSQALILISEINSNGTGGDFFELYNYGGSTIDLAGYLWTDNSAAAWNGANTYTLNTFSLAPGQAAVFMADVGQNGAGNAAFVTSWGSPLSLSAMGGFSGPIPPNSALTGRGLGQNDAVLVHLLPKVFLELLRRRIDFVLDRRRRRRRRRLLHHLLLHLRLQHKRREMSGGRQG